MIMNNNEYYYATAFHKVLWKVWISLWKVWLSLAVLNPWYASEWLM